MRNTWVTASMMSLVGRPALVLLVLLSLLILVLQLMCYFWKRTKVPSSSISGRIASKLKTVQATAYAKVDGNPPERHSDCIPVMVSITALPETIEQRAPLDLVVVLHVREDCKVPSNWKKLLADAMDTIVAKLDGRDDRLAFIAGTITTLIRPQRYYPKLVQGNSTSLTEALESAESILYGRKEEDKKNRTGCIIVISNSNENMDSLLPWRLRSVHAFGFRDANNARTMHSISSCGDSTFAILDDERGHITQAFFATITRITSAVAAMPVEVKLMCEQTVVLKAIGTPGMSCYISYDDKAAIMWPNVHMAAGVTTNIIVYLGGLIQPRDLPQLLEVQLKHGNVVDKLGVQLVREGSDGSKEVAAEIVRMEAVEIVADIVAEDKYDWEQLHTARNDLRQRWETLVNSQCGREAREAGLISELVAQMREMQARLYRNYYWLEYMLSWQSHQIRQLPLPQHFMDSQCTNDDPLLQLKILAKADGNGTIKEHQKALPVMVRVMAPETELAMAKRASVDLILVIDVDASYRAKEKQKKIGEKLHLLIKAEEMDQQQKIAKTMVVELEKSLKPLAEDNEDENKSLEMEDKITQKRQEMRTPSLRFLSRSAPEAKEEKKNARLEIEGKITKKGQEIDHMANEINTLRRQAMELEKVIENTKGRLDLLADAIELVTTELSVKDRLAIIPVQSSVTKPETATGLLNMSEQGRIETLNKVQKLSMALMTDNKAAQVLHDKSPRFSKINKTFKALQWREQKKKAMTVTRNSLHSGPSSSNTSPRSAKSTNMLHEALMCAMKILDDRQGEEKNRLCSIILISDNDDDSICMETLSPNYMVHAFGFYGTHNARALYHIARSCNGIYSIINNNRNQITEAFISCINKMTSTISVDTKVEIMCSASSNVALSTIESAQFRYTIGNDRKSCSILVGAVSAGQVKNFIIYVDNVREDDYDKISKYITVRIKWMHPLKNEVGELEGQLVVVMDGTVGYEDVMENIDHIEAVKIASNIIDPNHSKKMMVDMLQQMCIKCPEFARCAEHRLEWLASQMQMLDADRHLEDTDPHGYKNMVAHKLSYILSWLSYQRSYCWIAII